MSTASQTIPVTVIGFGSSARTFHLPFVTSLPEGFHLHSIQQRPGSKSGPDASQVYPRTIIHPSIQSVFGLDAAADEANALPKGGLVVITIANSLHFSTAKLALENGRHVLCEKPLALQSEQVLELERVAKENGVLVSAFQNRRWDSDFITLRSMLEPESSYYLGTPLFFESHFDRYRPLAKGGWREEVTVSQGGGILWDLGSHLVDQAVALFGAPASLLAIVRNSRGQQSSQLDDSFHLHLFYDAQAPLDSTAPAAGTTPAGLQCVLSASVLASQPDQQQLRFKVHATRGSFVKHALDPQENQLKAGQSPRTHPETFGAYDDQEPEAVKVAQVTSLKDSSRDWKQHPADPTKPPALVQQDVPVEKGRYIELYSNLAEVITALNKLPEDDNKARANLVAQKQAIQTSSVATAIRILELARKSATEGRVIPFTPI